MRSAGNSSASGCQLPENQNNTMLGFSYTGYPGYHTSSGINNSVYDEAIYRVTPVLAVPIYDWNVLSENFTSESGWRRSSELICLRAKDIEPGSRSPPAIIPSAAPAPPKPSSATPRRHGMTTLTGMIVLGFLAVLLC